MFFPDPKISNLGSRVKKIPDLGSRFKKFPDPHQRIHVFLTQKIVSKLSEI